MMMESAESYGGKEFPECAPYHGVKGQMWETFVRNFAAAMSTREVADDSLEDTLYGLDVGGEQWLEERHPVVLSTTMGCGSLAITSVPTALPSLRAGRTPSAPSTCLDISTGTSQT